MNQNKEVVLKCLNNLNENLDEFLNEWKYHQSCSNSYEIINLYGFTKSSDTLNYMVVMDYANKELMKKCWNEDPLKRPSASEVKYIIGNWIFQPISNEINEELENNKMEFINAQTGHSNLTTESHPQACYTSRLLNFTSKKLNEILESEDSQSYSSTGITEDLNDCIIKDMNN
ncbi:uncharacterized protein OCT59_007050 [Rhizophagus irregularis]|uniref:uncharacterized protein n=1 Tax=Rhizophagus irregularis TaxID=588596 RepID=UPI0033300B8A|nr:hypothetical protein OCT59_007050 [Rhizophagus irregularis]